MPWQEGGWIEVKCKICEVESDGEEFCRAHSRAYVKVVQGYEVWKKGLRITWEDYLRRIRDNSLTGKWAREVAEYLINKKEDNNVEKS